ncbi:MAG: Mo-dependent nitrogenase C-terminal domain-containing protein [Cyanobacteria bacterium P01_G01_bin.67]
MNLVQQTFATLHLPEWIKQLSLKSSGTKANQAKIDLLAPFRRWLDGIEVKDSAFAHRICKSIPSQCPFARELKLWGRTIVRIPPMCKLNPLYDEIIALRFRAICYLADTCGEDISVYC